MVTQKFRLKDGTVVTAQKIVGGSILGITAEGNPRYFTKDDIDYQIGAPEAQNSPSNKEND